jgi:ABC-type methionine transport system ATPase subunit
MNSEHRVRLTYPAHLLSQPLIYELIHRYDLVTNILEAQISEDAGWLLLRVRGESAQVEAGLAWIAGLGVQVETCGEGA